MLRLSLLLAAVAAILVPFAAAAGPAPGVSAKLLTASGRYTATTTGDGWDTVLRTGDVTRKLAGTWGFPKVTFGGATEGLSHDGRTLVLAERTPGNLASPSRFRILDPRSLVVRRSISLPGQFAYDALAPNARKLYLVEYVTVMQQLRYRVRSYDLTRGKLDRQVIADKRSGWTAMEGMPVARATSKDGTWIYTLYANGATPFVHALNARQGYAVCVDLPIGQVDLAGARLRLADGRLSVATRGGGRAVVNTRSLRVVGE
jgi:hypothetical protein